ncbi:guanylate kinase [Cohnella massiliensis]|uniref:guanylate kinase n=1 Tax=Cohnella massiliensis TaxID=1816691 RepID=UPI0009BB2DBB|nr:guanylate kinase [Cohnella massiliensis]
MSILLVVFQGPSASGKSTIQTMLGLPRIVTWTSRKPREGEVDGVDYFFKTKDEMRMLYEQGRMIEMTEYHENFYGTPTLLVEEIIRRSERKSVILDEAGARKMKQLFHDKVLLIGVKAERHECARRLEQRGHSPSDINARLGSFEAEIDALSQCELVLNNTDENRGKIDQLVRFLKEGMEKRHGSL